jgi:hypothetical protein
LSNAPVSVCVRGLRARGGHTDLPVIPLPLGLGDLHLHVLLSLLRSFDVTLELVFQLLAGLLELFELGARVREHVRNLHVLCAPVDRRRRIATICTTIRSVSAR